MNIFLTKENNPSHFLSMDGDIFRYEHLTLTRQIPNSYPVASIVWIMEMTIWVIKVVVNCNNFF